MIEAKVVFLTLVQAAAILNVSPATARDYARRGLVPARKIGKHWRFLEADLYEVGVSNQLGPSNLPALRFSGLASTSVDAKLDAALAQRTGHKPRGWRKSSVTK